MVDNYDRLDNMMKETAGVSMDQYTKAWIIHFGAIFKHVGKCDVCLQKYKEIMKHGTDEGLLGNVLDKIEELRDGR